jgi:hypothetical protein
MEGTVNLELEPLLDLEMDFEFVPGTPGNLMGHPDHRYPAEDPEYDIGAIRVCHNNKWHQVPDWLSEILEFKYQDQFIEAAEENLEKPLTERRS